MSKITKNNYVPCIKVDGDYTPIDKSTIFELTAGEQENDYDYICYENPVTEVDANKPELPSEIVLDTTNPIYNYVMGKFKALPVGSDCLEDFLMCFPDETDGKFKSGADAWSCQVLLSEKTLNTPDGKVTFSLKAYGDIDHGTYSVTESQGVKTITYTPSNSSQS